MQEKPIIALEEGVFREINNDKVEIQLKVKLNHRGRGDFTPRTMSGVLERRLCLAGKVRYYDPLANSSHIGNMALVDFRGVTDEHIENWFLNE